MTFCVLILGYSLNETSPLNHAVERGALVQLKCSLSEIDETDWKVNNFFDIRQDISDGVNVRKDMMDRFRVDVSAEGEVNLIFNASKLNSGKFGCGRDSTSKFSPYTAHLAQVIVLG